MIDQAEIHRMAQSEDVEERRKAANELRYNFAVLPDKEQAWNDLIRLMQDERKYKRSETADSLGAAFPHLPEKHREQAWSDIHRLTQDENDVVRRGAAYSLRIAFPHIPEKQREQAWSDMLRLTQDEHKYVRSETAHSLGAAFPHIPEKNREQAWSDMLRLTQEKQDKHWTVRGGAAYSLGASFPHIPEKHREQAWNDLHSLTQDENDAVREGAASSLSSAFPSISEKNREQAWSDMLRLTQDKNNNVRAVANHSLGRTSIFKATEAGNDEDFRNDMEKALVYFESSSKEAKYYNPARFCLPFYRSFYTITFRKQEAEDEVKKYLEEAKSEVTGSESKEKLLEAVENLSNALTETQKAMEMNLEGKKCELNAYRRYCDRAAELLETTEEKAPGATRLIRKGLPIIDERIKGIISEIQEKSKALCIQTKGTPLEDLGKEVNLNGQALLHIRDPIGLEKSINYMQITLSAICAKMPEDERREACELLEKANEELYVEDKVYLIDIILGKVSSQLSFQTILEELKSELKARFDKIEKNIDDIAQDNKDIKDILRSSLTKTEGYLKDLLDESKKGDSKAQDFIKKFSEAIIKKLEEGDKDWFENLRAELIKNEDKIENEIASAPPDIKSKLCKWINDIKHKINKESIEKETKEIVKKLPTEAVVIISAEKILEYGIPFLSAAISSPVAFPALFTILYALRGIVPKDK